MKIAVVGGGAAGLMAVATLLESETSAEITLFEKNNTVGQKVMISGGGRCNVTTGIFDLKSLQEKYTRGYNFLLPALKNFPPRMVMDWFEKRGIPLKIEEDNRIFPRSNSSDDIINYFKNLFQKNKNFRLHLREKIEAVSLDEHKKFILDTKENRYLFDILVITTGGNAFKMTGSTGDGYYFASSLGHKITELGPSLNSFEVKEDWVKELSGVSLENAELLFEGEKRVKVKGPFLFTHFGISGPVTFSLSSHLAYEHITEDHPLLISFIPDAEKNYETWDKIIIEKANKESNKEISNLFSGLIPKRLSEIIIKEAKIDGNKKMAYLSKEERKTLVHLLTSKLKITLISRKKGDEFVTAGGVDLSEVSSKSMQSKLVPHLYFAGEILDVDGLTGGFNLQASWATGKLAADSILKSFI